MLAPLICGRLWHLLAYSDLILAVALTLCSELVLYHESVELMSDHSRVVQMISIWPNCWINRLKIFACSQLAQIDGLITMSLRNSTRHRKSFRKRHRSHILPTGRICIKARLGAILVFDTFLGCGWGSILARNFARIIGGHHHVLHIATCVTLSIAHTVISAGLWRCLLSPKLLLLA